MIATASPAIKKATARVLQLSEDERARLIHEYEVKARRDERARLNDAITKGRAEGITEGRAEGRAEGVIAVARNMLKRNRTIAEIAEDTGLSFNEIEKLAH